MAATITAFIFFQKFKEQIGLGNIDLTSADTIKCSLHHSGCNVSTDLQISTIASVTGTASNGGGNFPATLANVEWTSKSAAPGSVFAFDSDAIVITASGGTMTVKFAVFYYSGVCPIGYIQLTNSDTEVTDGNTVTITPNAAGWFTMD